MGPPRLVGAFALTALGLAGLTGVLLSLRDELALASVVILDLTVVVTVAALGGLWPATAAAVGSDLLVSFFFVPPYHTFSVDSRDHVIVLLIYLAAELAALLARLTPTETPTVA